MKNRWFLSQNVLFRGKNDENFMQIQCLKWLIYRENVKKVIGFNNWKKVVKTLKKVHFHPFSYNLLICMWLKNEIMSIFYMQKTKKKSLKKHVKNGKSSNFQKALKSSNQLQITFWIAEKIAIDCFDPNPKYEKNS